MAEQNSNQKISFYKDKAINLIPENKWDSFKLVENRLREDIARILGVGVEKIEIEKPKDEAFGDYSINIAMKVAKENGISPRDYAQGALEKLKSDNSLSNYVSEFTVAGPGFINFTIDNKFIVAEYIKKSLHSSDNIPVLAGKKIMFEYAHPNPFKAFHIGHLRNIILGESLIRILEQLGAEVIRVNYQGDVGMHIAKCLWAFQKIDEKDYPTDKTERVSLIAKCYAEGAQAFSDEKIQLEIKEINKKIYTKEDENINRLWELGKTWSLDKFHQLYERVYSSFVREYFESETLDNCKKFINEAIDKGILEKSEGAVIFKGDKYGMDTRVFLNSQGLPTYEGKELGLAHMEFTDYGDIDLCIHNVAVEQISFFKITFKVESLLNSEMYDGKQYHNAYEFVGLKTGKMSSRTGNVVLGEDIMNSAVEKVGAIVAERSGLTKEQLENISEIVGVGAIKYSFLNINPGSYLAFDLENSLSFDGNSGPYLQYSYARAKKMVKDSQIDFDKIDLSELVNKVNIESAEFDLMKKILDFDNVVIEAGKNLAPNLICNYLFELAQKFNGYYKQFSILKNEDENTKIFRVHLTKQYSEVIASGLNLLGIKVSESM
jgi:arginyl-tRNA synthetase